MVDFKYQEMFPLGEDTTEYRLLTQEHVSSKSFEDSEILGMKNKLRAQSLLTAYLTTL